MQLFTIEDFTKQTTKLCNSKLGVIDTVLNEFILQKTVHQMITVMVKYFNLTLTTVIVPNCGNIGIIVPKS